MGEVRPTFMVVVPRILEKIRVAARAKAQESKVGVCFRRGGSHRYRLG